MDLETRRQGVHLFTGLIFATIIHLLPTMGGFIFLGTMALLTFLFSKIMMKGKKIPFFSWLVDKTERKGKPPASGVTWYFLGVLFIFVLSIWLGIDKIFVIAAMLIVAIGDSICTGLGRKIGKKRLPRTTTMSYEGSTIGFGAAFFGAAFVLQLIMPTTPAMLIAAAGAFVGLIAEAYIRLDDNLTIPVCSWAAMVIVGSMLGVL